MSEFSFGSSGPKAPSSPFQRLQVKNPKAENDTEPRVSQAPIFNEVAQRDKDSAVRLSGLRDAVGNVEETAATLSSLSSSGGEVKTANVDASQPSVKDVEEAARLAEQIARALSENPRQFEDAQGSVDAARAEALTQGEDPKVA